MNISTQLKFVASIALIVMCAGIASSAVVSPAEVNVKATGAIGDGKADDTAAFEKAITLTKEKGGTVKVPPGKYRITRTLVLKTQTLLGAHAGAWVSDEQALPTILPETKDGPCIQLLSGGSVHGMQIFFDWGTTKPSPRPAAIELSGVGCRVTETKIFGAWDGIMADGKNNEI
ncbi:MAG: glycosyl hydrolase family 28-related protein, partial [Armatimonadota bacterium]